MRAQSEGRRLFMGGLSYDTTDSSLEAYLNPQWPTEECRVKRDQDGRSRGFAFIVFPTVTILESCFDSQPHWIDGKEVSLRRVQPDGGSVRRPDGGAEKRPISMGMTRYGGGGAGTTRVYIGSAPSDTSRHRGLDDTIEDEDLRSYFSQFGTVTGIAQHRWEDTGRKKGYGYMEFEEFEGAQAAMGTHTICGKALEAKAYSSQGGVRTPAGGSRLSYGHNNDGPSQGFDYGPTWNKNKRCRTDGPPPVPSTPYPTDEGICFDHQQGRCMRGERCKYRHREKGGGQGRGSNNANGNNGGGWSSSDNPAHLLEQMKSMMNQ